MYFPYFIAYIAIGFTITLIVFFWALKTGQFQDQQRARFLPLERDLASEGEGTSRWRQCEIYLLFFLACTGLVSSGAVLVFALISYSG